MMVTGSPHCVLTRIGTSIVTVERIAQQPGRAGTEVYEEPAHVLALQEVQPFEACEGRYREPSLRRDYAGIGRLLLLPADLPLEVRTRGRPERVVRCVFSPETLKLYGGDCDIYDRDVLATCLNIRHREMTDLMTLLCDEMRSPGLASATLIESLGVALMVQLARYVASHATGRTGYRGGLSRRHMKLMTEAIEGEDKCLSLSELSDLAGLSLRHLTRAFKQTAGITIYTYIEQVRLEKAKALMADTDMLMKDIAARLGFSCASGLSVAFRKLTGESPNDYRKRVRQARTIVPAAPEHMHGPAGRSLQ